MANVASIPSAFTANTDIDEATDAYIYIGSSTVIISNTFFANSDTYDKIVSVSLNEDGTGLSNENEKIITVTPCNTDDPENAHFDITFHTSYDTIPLKIEFEGGAAKYITLHRVGLRIGQVSQGDASNYDNCPTADRIIYGTYYHPTTNGGTATTDIDLVVTITKNDGTREVTSATLLTDSNRTIPGIGEAANNWQSAAIYSESS